LANRFGVVNVAPLNMLVPPVGVVNQLYTIVGSGVVVEAVKVPVAPVLTV
jgi:hypothetical protein